RHSVILPRPGGLSRAVMLSAKIYGRFRPGDHRRARASPGAGAPGPRLSLAHAPSFPRLTHARRPPAGWSSPMANRTDRLDTIVSLSKRRGFVYPSSEIYGGLRASWDYGPLGVEMKNNIKRQWWKSMVQERDDIVGLDSS